MRNLDIGVLRSFLLIAGGRSFAETAELVGRSASAVTLQIQKLEAELGVAVLRRTPREVALTVAGERLMAQARRLVQINDEVLAAFRAPADARPLRVGMTQDFADEALADVLHLFAQEHPSSPLSLRVDRSARLIEALHGGQLDLAVAIRREDYAYGGDLAELPMIWIGREGAERAEQPLPLILFDPPCSFREAALQALDGAGLAHRMVFTSPSLAGLRAAALAGLGLTVRTRHLLSPGLADMTDALGLPALPQAVFGFYAADRRSWPAREDFAALCRRRFGA